MLLARSVRPSLALVAALSLAAQLPACAKVATAPMTAGATPVEAEEPLPGDRTGTLAMLDRAESDLTSALAATVPAPAKVAAGQMPAGEMKYAAAKPAMAPPPPEAAPPPKAPAAPVSRTEADEARPAPAQEASPSEAPAGADRPAASPCERACRALGSMQRATGHLCELSGEADVMCELGRKRVKNAVERVEAACPACQE